MIYFLHGTDIDKSRAKAHELIDSLLKKKPDASFFKLDAENFNSTVMDGYIGGQGLFESKYVVFLDHLSGDKKTKEDFLEKIKDIAESKNIFIILEGKLDKASLTKIEKKSEKAQEFILPEKKEKESYNAFALSEAFAKRDRKNAWVLYRKSIDKGEAPEALHGMLFWKVKTMILSSSFGIYNKEETSKLANDLITIYHEARRGRHELETSLEAFLLNL